MLCCSEPPAPNGCVIKAAFDSLHSFGMTDDLVFRFFLRGYDKGACEKHSDAVDRMAAALDNGETLRVDEVLSLLAPAFAFWEVPLLLVDNLTHRKKVYVEGASGAVASGAVKFALGFKHPHHVELVPLDSSHPWEAFLDGELGAMHAGSSRGNDVS